MRCFDRVRWLCGAVIGLLLCSCASVQPGTEPGASIGTLHVVAGSEVYVNGKKAFDGRPIYREDDVATGSGSSAVVNFPDGGFVHLDQNTDPTIRQWFEYGKCVIGSFFEFGRAYGETGSECDIVVKDANLEGVARTAFNLEIGAGHSTLTVLRGTMYLRLSGGERPVHAGQQVVVSRHHLVRVSDLSPEELSRVMSWRSRFALLGWCCDDGRVFRSDREGCGRSGGVFFADERSARARCRPTPPTDGGPGSDRHPPDRQGWCCDDGKVFLSDPEGCKRKGGTFFVNERTARDECKITGPDDKRAFCDQYAKKAVSQNEDSMARKCGYTGARWLSNYNAHFTWCMNTDRAAADAERNARDGDLKRCEAGSTKPPGELEQDTDRPGSDFRDFDLKMADPGLCRDACMREPKCRAWTYVKPDPDRPRAHCWLKHSVPPPRKDKCCVSGVKFTGPD